MIGDLLRWVFLMLSTPLWGGERDQEESMILPSLEEEEETNSGSGEEEQSCNHYNHKTERKIAQYKKNKSIVKTGKNHYYYNDYCNESQQQQQQQSHDNNKNDVVVVMEEKETSLSNNKEFVNLLLMKVLEPSCTGTILDTLFKLDLCENVSAKNAFRGTNICETLLYLLETSSEEQSKICGLITIFTLDDDYFLQHFVTNGAVEAIVNTMKRISNDERLQEMGLATIVNMIPFAIENGNNEPDIQIVIANAMQNFPLNADLQCDAIGCLYYYTMNDDTSSLLLSTTDDDDECCCLIELILIAIDYHYMDYKDLVESACFVLKTQLLTNEEAKYRFQLREGTIVLAKVESHYRSSNPDIANMVTSILRIMYQ